MSKQWKPFTPEQTAARNKRREQLAAESNAMIAAAVAGFKRGASKEEIHADMQAAMDSVSPPRAPRLPMIDPDMPVTAYPRLAGEGWTAEKQRAFLTHLAETGSVSHACAQVGLSRASAYKLRQRAPNSVFTIGWDVAIHMARQALLDEATERALAGREVPVWYHGEQVGTRIVHNDRLLMFLLGLKRDPLHPALDAREMTHLFPAMLKVVDTIMPPAFTKERIAELTGEQDGQEEDF